MINEIKKLNSKIDSGIKIQEILIDVLLGILIFSIIFGIGFTFGVYSR